MAKMGDSVTGQTGKSHQPEFILQTAIKFIALFICFEFFLVLRFFRMNSSLTKREGPISTPQGKILPSSSALRKITMGPSHREIQCQQ